MGICLLISILYAFMAPISRVAGESGNVLIGEYIRRVLPPSETNILHLQRVS